MHMYEQIQENFSNRTTSLISCFDYGIYLVFFIFVKVIKSHCFSSYQPIGFLKKLETKLRNNLTYWRIKASMESVSNLKCSEDRLDHFYATHLNKLTVVWKLCGVLLERFLYTYFHTETPLLRVGSLSTRTCLVVQNLEEWSLIAQRFV